MFSFGYSFFLSGPIIGYTSLSYFYIFSIVFYMIHYFDTIAKHPFLVALQMHPYQCSSLQNYDKLLITSRVGTTQRPHRAMWAMVTSYRRESVSRKH